MRNRHLTIVGAGSNGMEAAAAPPHILWSAAGQPDVRPNIWIPMRSLVVRKFARDEWRVFRVLRLAALTESPDAFGSTLTHESGRADDDWAERLSRGASSSRDRPLVAEVDDEPGGLTWVRLVDDDHTEDAHLYQMWLAPKSRGRGVGRALRDAAIAWARLSL